MKNMQSSFKLSLFKFISNVFYNKMVDNVHKWVNVQLITNPTNFVYAIWNLSYKCSMIINDDLVLIENQRVKNHAVETNRRRHHDTGNYVRIFLWLSVDNVRKTILVVFYGRQ